MGGLHTPIKWGGVVLVDEMIAGSGDTISSKVMHGLQPHHDFCSFLRFAPGLVLKTCYYSH
eukprot:scaffold79973_cov54-Attheya_sp.AAC.1